MKFASHVHYSFNLGREMHYNVYGHAGKPVLVFPTSGGMANEFADNNMIAVCQDFIDRGRLQFYTVDSNNYEAFEAIGKTPHDMALAHEAYDRYIIEEMLPLIKSKSHWDGALIVTGCSMGGYQVMDFALHHPDVFDTAIALSGLYDLHFLVGDYGWDETVYRHSPAEWLYSVNDSWFLDQYRRNTYIICTGQGAYEEPNQVQKLQQAFNTKGINAWFDYWGYDVRHDWDWWQKQLPYFLENLEAQGKF